MYHVSNVVWVDEQPVKESKGIDTVIVHDKYDYLVGMFDNIHELNFEGVSVRRMAVSNTKDGKNIMYIELDDWMGSIEYTVSLNVKIHANDTVAVRRTLVIKRRRK